MEGNVKKNRRERMVEAAATAAAASKASHSAWTTMQQHRRSWLATRREEAGGGGAGGGMTLSSRRSYGGGCTSNSSGSSSSGLLVLLLCVQCCLATMPGSAKHYTIHWNSSNPIFRIDNTDNVIDVNRNNIKFEYDQVNLICPVYTPGTKEEEMEKYIIYNVSKDEFETCRITNANPRIIAVCDKPYKLMYFTITFRPFTPQPGGLEFLPGHDYYFISTSTGDDLHRRIGGRCTTHNMKIVFKVWAPPFETTTRPTTTSAAPGAAIGGGGGAMVPARPAWSSAVPPSRTTAVHQQLQPHFATSTSTTSSTQKPPATTKKVKTYSKHPNEVVKSEELTLAGSSLEMNLVLLGAVLPLVLALR